MDRKPRVGDIVNFVRKHPRDGAIEIRPMMIVRTFQASESLQLVNGVVFIDGQNDIKGDVIARDPSGNPMYPVTEWATSVVYSEPAEGEPLSQETWHWPSDLVREV